MYTDLSVEWYKEKGTDPGLIMSRTDYVIKYPDYLAMRESWLQTEILLSTTEAEYITLYQSMRDDFTFVTLMKDIDYVLKLQREIMKVLFSLFEKNQSHHTNIIKGQLHSQLIHKYNLVPSIS